MSESITANMKDTRANDSKMSNQKRLNSLLEMKKLYRLKMNAVKAALTNIDTKVNNKLVFENDDYDEENSHNNDAKAKSQYNTEKKLLFADEANQEDDEEYNFEIKEAFQGKKGKKLMELQLKFKNDKRFKMDEKFLDDSNVSENELEQVSHKPRENIIDSEENGSNTHVTVEEKQVELAILEKVLGEKNMRSEDKGQLRKKAVSVGGMIRYDPTNPEHSKYVLQQGDRSKEKQNKKRKHHNSDLETQVVQKPVVSKETFYEVQENLKETLKEDRPFSLLSLFGDCKSSNHLTQSNHDGGEDVVRDSFKTSEKNPFHYDSTDDENSNDETNEVGEESQRHIESAHQDKTNKVIVGSTKMWREPLFFKEDDYRFQEGTDFVRKFGLDDKMEFKQVRRNIKEIVRAKIRNNQRKNKPFRKKLGGKRIIKIKKAMKNR